ncbi:winged helix-turn-helix domain-containing protein [Terrimonas sp. NA20]|uniref:Winged helix-turn-helix domain-containing protein n=1 Tax=Terrimonas ginsenosidimutans TaxID=2908004 RepID=A0ABS9KP97_9BACT|nr:winged helix-turn-helix domain-containing protein [Terrimonas ginsenosidimutans]MCG2614126.1 winged helix-turn-helix domain-containing protein [Terrimonas ginsenosidimutans]
MQTQEILIDQRFVLMADKHLLVDRQTGTQSRLEPRFVKLLQMLAASAGQTVSRERIIREIWNDYGGADDGLNQAISFLRKILDDSGKERIKTIPKKGYLLQATVDIIAAPEERSFPETAQPLQTASQQSARRRIITSLIILALIIAALFFFGRNKTDGPDEYGEPAGTEIDTTYQYKEMKEPH